MRQNQQIHHSGYACHNSQQRYQKTDNPLPYALADYNAGRSHVLRWNKDAASTNNAVFIEQMDFPSTRQYVKTVMRRYEYYRVTSPP